MSQWNQIGKVEQWRFKCGYCGLEVAPNEGYIRQAANHYPITGRIIICPHCDSPTYVDGNRQQTPGVLMGDGVEGITDKEVENMYTEARKCSSIGAYTACVLVCRKILMNVAVHQTAAENLKFIEYVNFLESQGFIPPNGRAFVDEIRKRGNTATHEIKLMTKDDAEIVLDFTNMLLVFVYEVPFKLSKRAPKK